MRVRQAHEGAASICLTNARARSSSCSSRDCHWSTPPLPNRMRSSASGFGRKIILRGTISKHGGKSRLEPAYHHENKRFRNRKMTADNEISDLIRKSCPRKNIPREQLFFCRQSNSPCYYPKHNINASERLSVPTRQSRNSRMKRQYRSGRCRR